MALEVEAPLLDESDDALVARFQAGDTQALDVLLTRYRRFARAKVRNYFLVGADADDLEQEGSHRPLQGRSRLPRRPGGQLPGVRRAVHHSPDHYRGQSGDPPEAPAAERVRLDLDRPFEFR